MKGDRVEVRIPRHEVGHPLLRRADEAFVEEHADESGDEALCDRPEVRAPVGSPVAVVVLEYEIPVLHDQERSAQRVVPRESIRRLEPRRVNAVLVGRSGSPAVGRPVLPIRRGPGVAFLGHEDVPRGSARPHDETEEARQRKAPEHVAILPRTVSAFHL